MPDLSGLEGLTGRGGDVNEKVSFLRNILPEYIAEDYSYSDALKDLRANDFSIGTSLFYAVRRQIEGLKSLPGTVSNLPGDYFPSINDLGQNPERQDKAFKFIYVAGVYDEDNTFLYSQRFSMQMNSFGSISELRALGNQYFSEIYPGTEEFKTVVSLEYGLRKT